MSTLIKNGRIITAEQDYVADIYIEKEKVTLIGENLNNEAENIIDAKSKYVIPGGIDVHTHLDMPFSGTTTSDDFCFRVNFMKMPEEPSCIPVSLMCYCAGIYNINIG